MSRIARIFIALALFLAVPVLAAGPAAAARVKNVVTVTVESVSPSVPAVTTAPAPMTFMVRLTNTTDRAYSDVRVLAEREMPVTTQAELDQSAAATAAPDNGLSVPATQDVEVATLPAKSSVDVVYSITTSTTDEAASLCLCNEGLYPLWIGAQVTQQDGSARILGGSRTFVPSMVGSAQPLQVGWLWPLIDRPHRLTGDRVFVDDTLADSISAGGRLDRALQVAEAVGPTVPITLLIDPELVDELAVMANLPYRVENGSGTTLGVGQAAARAWLHRLADVLTNDRAVQVAITPWADPDQPTLVGEGLPWSSAMPASMAQRVSTVLAGRTPAADLSWPTGGVINSKALRVLAAAGASQFVLDQATLVTRKTYPTLVHLTSYSAQADAAITVPAVQQAAAQVLTRGGSGDEALPSLVAQVAIRTVETNGPQFLAVTPPRYVDPSPDLAIQAIRATSSGPIASPVALATGIAGADTAGRLTKTLPATNTLPKSVIANAAAVDRDRPVVQDLLIPTRTTRALEVGYAFGRQRVLSSGWRSGASSDGPAVGAMLAVRLRHDTAALLAGVRILPPSSRNYTLTQKDSKLPIAVKNDLPYAVRARVDVDTVDNLPGLTAKSTLLTVDARAQVSFRIPTQVVRSGVFHVAAQLATPGDVHLGRPVSLTVHSTKLGLVGVIITAVAGGVLVLALLVRFVRRARYRRKHRAPAPAAVLEREPAS